MYWVTAKNVVVSVPRWRSLSLFFRPPLRRRFYFSSTPHTLYHSLSSRSPMLYSFHVHHFFVDALFACYCATLAHYQIQRMEFLRKPSSVLLAKRLTYYNVLGVDPSLRNGSLKEGTLNSEMLQFKSKFPREVLLCRVGDFYEAIGFDACILVEYAGLNPFGGLRSDSIPKAGCPVNLRQTLDDLTRNGFSVCVVEEVQGPTQARSRKSRFISGHAHPGSPYVFGLVGDDQDLDFPEPMPVVGISRSVKGYCIVSVYETMKTYSVEDGLTEEAVVTKLRTCRCHHLFLHNSLKNNSSGLQIGHSVLLFLHRE
ncbi:DNA mismatch repair protein MSH1, mitochondrial [Capsicum baccatum]|uniref:DNA mismatch repair protein MSH1, mitochondrial n=1 Tax=Capsicum baccatum TaxID=33114 RepID=A0A2G2W230_CAPBA|nr:DNA mismatch repair protein MSH1, mitochondrial [Capsicum baccatum]